MKIYAQIGVAGYLQTSNNAPDGYVLMNDLPLTPNCVAQADGTWIEKIPVPKNVSKVQAVLSLSRAGIWPAFNAYLNADDTSDEHKLAWENLSEVHRDSEMLAEIAGALELTDDQVNALFVSASQIKA